jgi:hypothetical protein
MKRVVFVVEGQTEQIFLLKFIENMVRLKHYHIALHKLHRGALGYVSSRGRPEKDATHYIQIINVENDEKVLSYVEDNLDSFKSKGFEAVYGLRDRYSGDKNKTQVNPMMVDKRTQFLQVKHGLVVEITIAIEEIEAWFLSVPDFFQKYNNSLNLKTVNKILNINLSTTPVESLTHPSVLIHQVLESVNLAYKKRLGDAHRITDSLDYDSLYLDKVTSVQSLNRLVQQLTHALS